MTHIARFLPDPEAWYLALALWRHTAHSRPLLRVYRYTRRTGTARRQRLWCLLS